MSYSTLNTTTIFTCYRRYGFRNRLRNRNKLATIILSLPGLPYLCVFRSDSAVTPSPQLVVMNGTFL